MAAQIGQSFNTYGQFMGVTVAVVFGGVAIRPQITALARGADVLVATPGRLLDHIGERTIALSGTEILVLDEVDQMLDLGFIRPIKRIVAQLSAKRQNLFFSATMPKEISGLADDLLTDPVKVSVAPASTTAERVEQSVIHIEAGAKRTLLAQLCAGPDLTRTLVFTRTKRGADRVARHLAGESIPAFAIHGNKSQRQREDALHAFRKGRTRVLVATDIAARGIDIDGISHVVNFELPDVPEAYVHRIGRTARAGASGKAISLCAPDERDKLRAIERLIRQSIPSEDRRGQIEITASRHDDDRRSSDNDRQRSQGGRRPGPIRAKAGGASKAVMVSVSGRQATSGARVGVSRVGNTAATAKSGAQVETASAGSKPAMETAAHGARVGNVVAIVAVRAARRTASGARIVAARAAHRTASGVRIVAARAARRAASGARIVAVVTARRAASVVRIVAVAIARRAASAARTIAVRTAQRAATIAPGKLVGVGRTASDATRRATTIAAAQRARVALDAASVGPTSASTSAVRGNRDRQDQRARGMLAPSRGLAPVSAGRKASRASMHGKATPMVRTGRRIPVRLGQSAGATGRDRPRTQAAGFVVAAMRAQESPTASGEMARRGKNGARTDSGRREKTARHRRSDPGSRSLRGSPMGSPRGSDGAVTQADHRQRRAEAQRSDRHAPSA